MIGDVKGIGPATARLLIEAGLKTVEDLANASIDQVKAIQGFSDIRAAKIIEEARDILSKEEKPKEKKKAKDSKGAAKKQKKEEKDKKSKKDKKSEKNRKKTKEIDSSKKKGKKKK